MTASAIWWCGPTRLPPALTAGTTFYYYAGQQMIESVDQQPASPVDGTKAYTNQYVFSPRLRQFADPRHANHVYFVRRLMALVSVHLLLLDRCQLQRHGAPEFQRRASSSATSTPPMGPRRSIRRTTRLVTRRRHTTTRSSSPACGSIRPRASGGPQRAGQHRPRHVHDLGPRRRARTGSNTAETTRPTKPTPLGWSTATSPPG